MRKLAAACVLATAIPLGACSTLGALLAGGSLAQSAPHSVADAEKALAVAHLAYQAVGVSLQAAAQSGALNGAAAAAAKALYDRAGAALDAADRADTLADAQGVIAAAVEAQALIAQIDAQIPK